MGNLVVFILLWTFWIVVTAGFGLVLVPVYWFLVFKDSDARIARAQQKLQSTLMNNEHLIRSALQMRLSALLNRRLLLGITTSRIILVNRSVFGGFTMRDYQWKDLSDAQLSENILPDWFGSRLNFKVLSGAPTTIDGIRSEDASEIYKYAQQQEQEWEEKRRVRALEETRAASGGMTFNAAGLAPTLGAASAGGGVLEEIQKAKQMLDSGVISDAEFSEIKSKILARGVY